MASPQAIGRVAADVECGDWLDGIHRMIANGRESHRRFAAAFTIP
jgi:hypothetical protein